jgi:hypothetical protein
MNYFLRSYTLLFVLLFVIGEHHTTTAQTPQNSIFDKLERTQKTGEGGVVIHQSENIKRVVGTRINSHNTDITKGKAHFKTMGYRIQVFSGNLRSSKDETMSLQAKINELYAHVKTYPEYLAPWWKLYVGDYLTFEEAALMRRELQRVFPQRKNDISIYETEIQLPLE